MGEVDAPTWEQVKSPTGGWDAAIAAGAQVQVSETRVSMYPVCGEWVFAKAMVTHGQKRWSFSYEPWPSIIGRHVREVLAELGKE